jgi:hypothetical protein
MADLSPKGRKLIDVAMANDEPPPADESWGSLVSRLTGEGSRGTFAMPEPERSAARRAWIAIAIAIAIVLAIVVVWSSSPEPSEPRPEVRTKAVEPANPPPAKKLPAQASPEPAVAHLLDDAEAALADGDADRAMALLQRHAELAPTDDRAPQRMALRVLALCAKGEQERARDEAKAFLGAHGQSQWADRVRRSCAGAEPR